MNKTFALFSALIACMVRCSGLPVPIPTIKTFFMSKPLPRRVPCLWPIEQMDARPRLPEEHLVDQYERLIHAAKYPIKHDKYF
jgi:hypothetical protein